MSLFPVKADAVTAFRAELAAGAGKYIKAAALADDDLLYAKLLAAEADAHRELRVYFEPTYILPDDAAQSELDALDSAETRYAQEAAYDYDRDFFAADRWGYIVTKAKPIISVESIRFSYPSPLGQIFTLPHEWIRLDKKYGHIRIIPTALSASVPMAAFIMQSISGGCTIPFMIQVRYTAGLKDAAADYPDLIDLIKKMATFRLLKTAYLPASGSISADGLSQSKSVDLSKWSDEIKKDTDTLRDAIHGIRMTVC